MMPNVVLVLIVLTSVTMWRPAEAAQRMDRSQMDIAVQWKSIPGDVTFEVPLNLTRLAPDITKVLVTCSLASDAFPIRKIRGVAVQWPYGATVELPVSAGHLVTTARVVVSITVDKFMDPATGVGQEPTGKSANYQCDIMGFSSRGGGWQQFTDTSPNTSLRLSPTPAPITGTFVW